MTSTIQGRTAPLWRVFAYALFIAAVTLLFCSKSSPAYPINDWTDANIYFSVGKGMLEGRVVYRDLYDHKGPLLYALHALCAWLSPMSFTGVYVLEVFFAASFLTSAYRLLALYHVQSAAFFALPLLSLIVYTSLSFQQGDSAEELCLPLLAVSMTALLAHLKTEYPKRMSSRRLMLNGFLFGCVFWIKFTLCGLNAAFLIVLFVSQAARGEWKRAFQCVGWFALGFVLSTLPWLAYFGLNGAILPWLKTYLYDNLFLYSQGEASDGLLARAKDVIKSALSWFAGNLRYTLPLAFGVGWFAFRRTFSKWERISAVLMAFLCALGTFFGGKTYLYYGLVVAVLTPLFLIPLCGLLQRILPAGRRLRAGLCALCLTICLALPYALSPNVKTSFGMSRESTMQYQLSEVIDQYDHPTLLNYGFMDAGFFTAAGIAPSVKYFHQTNVPLQEMLDEQIRYIQEGLCDFVVTRGKQPACIDDLYYLVMTADSPDGFWYDHVYLYRLKTLENEGR